MVIKKNKKKQNDNKQQQLSFNRCSRHCYSVVRRVIYIYIYTHTHARQWLNNVAVTELTLNGPVSQIMYKRPLILDAPFHTLSKSTPFNDYQNVLIH